MKLMPIAHRPCCPFMAGKKGGLTLRTVWEPSVPGSRLCLCCRAWASPWALWIKLGVSLSGHTDTAVEAKWASEGCSSCLWLNRQTEAQRGQVILLGHTTQMGTQTSISYFSPFPSDQAVILRSLPSIFQYVKYREEGRIVHTAPLRGL